jgi:hypothetical protein
MELGSIVTFLLKLGIGVGLRGVELRLEVLEDR